MKKKLDSLSNLSMFEEDAAQLLLAFKKENKNIVRRIKTLPKFSKIKKNSNIFVEQLSLTEARHIVALENGFLSWDELKNTYKDGLLFSPVEEEEHERRRRGF
jgi:hypothetical protein